MAAQPEPASAGVFEESKAVKQRSCRAKWILGLLCLLLVVGLIILLFLYFEGNSKWKIEMLQLQTTYNNLTEKNYQLQTSYNNLTEKNHQLQTSYNNLTEKIHQLQTSYNNLTGQNDKLEKKLQDVTTDLRRKLEALRSNEWKYFAGSFYYISSTEKTWQESRDDCLQNGADLVIIKSREEQEFARSWKKRMWIGMTDTETEGTWKWVDGTLLDNPRYWEKSEPNNFDGNENCGELYYDVLENTWNDAPCSHKRHWICEIQLNI